MLGVSNFFYNNSVAINIKYIQYLEMQYCICYDCYILSFIASKTQVVH